MDNSIIDIVSATNMQKGLLVMAVGISGVFLALILFFMVMKVIIWLLPFKESKDNDIV